jgi:hypothetical protein
MHLWPKGKMATDKATRPLPEMQPPDKGAAEHMGLMQLFARLRDVLAGHLQVPTLNRAGR